jgi:F-type H+-transporting ATPase subunit gamma
VPSLKHTRKRISSVRSTQQITKAMKMVSAAKLRRAQEAAEKARPYGQRLNELLAGVAANAGEGSHPFLEPGAERPAELIVITSDRGLCGGYNTNLVKTAEAFLRSEAGRGATVVCCGRRGYDHFRRHHGDRITSKHVNRPFDLTLAREVAAEASRRFRAGEVGSVHVVSSSFRSAISQSPVRWQRRVSPPTTSTSRRPRSCSAPCSSATSTPGSTRPSSKPPPASTVRG